jgi:hypothetical protein
MVTGSLPSLSHPFSHPPQPGRRSQDACTRSVTAALSSPPAPRPPSGRAAWAPSARLPHPRGLRGIGHGYAGAAPRAVPDYPSQAGFSLARWRWLRHNPLLTVAERGMSRNDTGCCRAADTWLRLLHAVACSLCAASHPLPCFVSLLHCSSSARPGHTSCFSACRSVLQRSPNHSLYTSI